MTQEPEKPTLRFTQLDIRSWRWCVNFSSPTRGSGVSLSLETTSDEGLYLAQGPTTLSLNEPTLTRADAVVKGVQIARYQRELLQKGRAHPASARGTGLYSAKSLRARVATPRQARTKLHGARLCLSPPCG